MKRIVCLFLVLAIGLMLPIAAADTDFSQYSDEELITLLIMLQQEIANRNIEKTAELESGTYIVGKDIPAGSYMVSVTTTDEETCTLYLYGADQKVMYMNTTPRSQNEEFHISLEEGQMLCISWKISITISPGIEFY